ncbi:MAG: GntR family transcriptional regulator, partial [Lentisphaerota bacterium]
MLKKVMAMRRRKKNPLYLQIHQEMRHKLVSGEYNKGSVLPSENTLCEKYKTSRFTVRASLKMLEKEGFAKNMPGRGWQVVSTEPEKKDSKMLNVSYVTYDDNTSHIHLILERIEEVLRKSNIDLRTHILPNDSSGHALSGYVHNYLDSGVCHGIIINCGNAPLPKNFWPEASSRKIPVVALLVEGHYSYDSISTDNYLTAMTLVEKLIAEGHQNILYMTSEGLQKLPAFRMRTRAYEKTMTSNGLKPEILNVKNNYWLGLSEEKLVDKTLTRLKKEKALPTCIIGSTFIPVQQVVPRIFRNSAITPEKLTVSYFSSNREKEKQDLTSCGVKSAVIVEERWGDIAENAVE